MPKTTTSLNQKLSDVVRALIFELNDNFKINYNFSVDPKYEVLIITRLELNISYNSIKFDNSYLEEEHIGNQEYFKTDLRYEKRNMVYFPF